MAKKKPRYSNTMFYKGVAVGKGTTADGETFALLLTECNNNPHEVFDRYMYFSPELKQALEKACVIYDKKKSR